jgi:hypothetical protein
MALTEEQKRRWMEQWRAAGPALRELRARELRAMSEQDSARAFDRLDLPPGAGYRRPADRQGCGLVEQQRIFSKAHAPSR